jgi:hypothetical protein
MTAESLARAAHIDVEQPLDCGIIDRVVLTYVLDDLLVDFAARPRVISNRGAETCKNLPTELVMGGLLGSRPGGWFQQLDFRFYMDVLTVN